MNTELITPAQTHALRELSETLHANNVPFVIIGGLAAIAWSAKRPLVDIDIQIGSVDLAKARELFSESLQTDIRHYVSEHWDITQMVINLHGTGIDICQAEAFYIVVKGTRVLVPNSINDAVGKVVNGIPIPVMPKAELINYKRVIARSVDIEDIAALEK